MTEREFALSMLAVADTRMSISGGERYFLEQTDLTQYVVFRVFLSDCSILSRYPYARLKDVICKVRNDFKSAKRIEMYNMIIGRFVVVWEGGK